MLSRVNTLHHAIVVALLTPLVFPSLVSFAGDQPQAFPLKGDLPGSERLLGEEPTYLVIGEMHGTREIPPLVAVLLRTVSTKGEAVLCLEISASEQASLDSFVRSDGGEAAIAALTASPHWAMRDGRASTGYLAMLQMVRQLVEDGHKVQVAAIDDDWTLKDAPKKLPTAEEALALAAKRDRAMADNVLKVVKQNADASLIVLVGNIHASTKSGAPWHANDKSYKPMACCLKKSLPELVSLNLESAGGQAWVMTDVGVGPRDFQGRDRGKQPFIELYDEPADGYDGVLYIGRMSAAPPAKKQASGIQDALEQLQELLAPVESEE